MSNLKNKNNMSKRGIYNNNKKIILTITIIIGIRVKLTITITRINTRIKIMNQQKDRWQ